MLLSVEFGWDGVHYIQMAAAELECFAGSLDASCGLVLRMSNLKVYEEYEWHQKSASSMVKSTS